ncbi:hypothetical protein Droror1_Dr00010639 [Drosera rotundifolia]
MSSTRELVFIPVPAMGHLIPAVEIVRRMVAQDSRISFVTLIFKMNSDAVVTAYIKSLQSDASFDRRIKFVELPPLENPPDTNSTTFFERMIEDYRPIVNRILKERIKSSRDQLAGFMVDMFCTAMMDVAEELNVPCYVFITSNAAFLNLTFHFQSLRDDHRVDVTEFTDPKTELDVPGFKNQVPCSVLPMVFLDKDRGCDDMLNQTKKYREAKGILINTFMELESHAIQSLSNDPRIPTIYPIGPIIDLNAHSQDGAGGPHGDAESIRRWLDEQPTASVVFLCFGSLGSFPEDQVREMAKGLERSGHRFLWSLRGPPTADDRFNHPTDLENLEQVLPEGFLDRTAKVGKIIGWAPQVAILSHPAVGGFASHCGWNSILESLWMGVPIAAWPMYAEQQLNAFAMVKELGLAVEIWMHYKWNHRKRVSNGIVEADTIERGIKMLMDNGNDNAVRAKVQEMSEVCRRAAMEGGSSSAQLASLIEDVLHSTLD